MRDVDACLDVRIVAGLGNNSALLLHSSRNRAHVCFGVILPHAQRSNLCVAYEKRGI